MPVDVQIEVGNDSNIVENSDNQAMILNSFEIENSIFDVNDANTVLENDDDFDF